MTEVCFAMATIGLAPVGSATLIDNFDSLVLGRAARKLLSTILDINVRELARDFFINQSFRRDVFVRDPRQLDSRTQRAGLTAATYALMRPASMVKYSTTTSAGRLKFDSKVARKIVDVLSGAPATLTAIATNTATEREVLASALALAAAGLIAPVEGGRVDVEKFNQAVRFRLGGAEEIRQIALPCGTAFPIVPDVERLILKTRSTARTGGLPVWREFFKSHGFNLSPHSVPAILKGRSSARTGRASKKG